jgi:hypothetical protein
MLTMRGLVRERDALVFVQTPGAHRRECSQIRITRQHV